MTGEVSKVSTAKVELLLVPPTVTPFPSPRVSPVLLRRRHLLPSLSKTYFLTISRIPHPVAGTKHLSIYCARHYSKHLKKSVLTCTRGAGNNLFCGEESSGTERFSSFSMATDLLSVGFGFLGLETGMA